MSRISMVQAELVIERASNWEGCLFCEACGGPVGSLKWAFHHRHARGMGGAGNHFPWIDQAVNLMLVHGDLRVNCHNLSEYSIHQNPARSERLGHIVPWGTDPATVPFRAARDLQELRA